MSKGYSSQITFLYFDDFVRACTFFAETLELDLALDAGWSRIYETGPNAYVGTVQRERGSVTGTGKSGFLISLTVDDAAAWRDKMLVRGVTSISELKTFPDIGLRSFFFEGPEGYSFEIQEFTNPELREKF